MSGVEEYQDIRVCEITGMNTVLGTGGLTLREQLITKLDHVTFSEQTRIRRVIDRLDENKEICNEMDRRRTTPS